MTTRIGVVADTHCPEFAPRLPDRLFEALAGCDLVLHAGDVNGRSTLEALAKIAPVEAVRGDHDGELRDLPLTRSLDVAGRKVVVVHGNRSRWIEEPQTFLWTVTLGFYRPHRRLAEQLARRFPGADVIVFGHTHRAQTARIGRQLLFNPGGVHQWNHETTRARLGQNVGWFEWCWLQVARHIRRSPPPTVGILELGDEVKAQVVRL
ncbi:MAG TPA: metallophosphoesterase family protein [Candidatus Dormibacteraeota bacterium]|nr:metallophosphoesterase family protein [Candidatus Dormibacteraeota bacterium]